MPWLVSFVVPVFNKVPFLPQVLAALLAQKGEFEREYIFVDDGSTDGSCDLLRQITSDWPYPVTILTQQNAGAASATNTGIRAAKGDFIKFCDADDLLTVDATQILLDAVVGADAVLGWADCSYFGGQQCPDLTAQRAEFDQEVIEDALPRLVRTSIFNPSQCLVRGDQLRQTGGADERTKHTQDYTIALRLSQLGRFVHLKTVITYLPEEAPGRVTAKDPGNQLSRVTRSLAYFFDDYPKADRRLLAYACHQAAGRVWKYQKRWQNKTILTSPWYWRHLITKLAPPKDTKYLHLCADALNPKPY